MRKGTYTFAKSVRPLSTMKRPTALAAGLSHNLNFSVLLLNI